MKSLSIVLRGNTFGRASRKEYVIVGRLEIPIALSFHPSVGLACRQCCVKMSDKPVSIAFVKA